MTSTSRPAVAAAALLLLTLTAQAHFQVILPATDIIPVEGPLQTSLRLIFTHPMEQGPVMNMKSPREFGVFYNGAKHDLLKTLTPQPLHGKMTYTTTFKFPAPADYIFYLAPAPYWEPAENKMIIHYTKVIVDVGDAQEGWDALVGLPVEIEPLVRPYGLWTGNVFRGIVRHDGKPVPFAEIEVEYWNAANKVHPPAQPFVTQVIKADSTGVFSYAIPRAGWWGFAALIEGPSMKNPAGRNVPSELGGLIWIRAVDMH